MSAIGKCQVAILSSLLTVTAWSQAVNPSGKVAPSGWQPGGVATMWSKGPGSSVVASDAWFMKDTKREVLVCRSRGQTGGGTCVSHPLPVILSDLAPVGASGGPLGEAGIISYFWLTDGKQVLVCVASEPMKPSCAEAR